MSLRASSSLPTRLFGAHVERRADGPVALRGGVRALGRARDAEVHELHEAVRENHDVRRLDVAVDDARLVNRREAAAELLRDLQAGREGEGALAVEDVAQRRAGHVLHREKPQAVRLAEVVRAHDVAVRDLPREPDLLLERHADGRALVEGFGQEDLHARPRRRARGRGRGRPFPCRPCRASRGSDSAPRRSSPRAVPRTRAPPRRARRRRASSVAARVDVRVGLPHLREHLLERGLLLQLAEHRAKRPGERADLVAARLRQLHVEIPFADLGRALRELRERTRDAPAHREGDREREQEREPAHEKQRVADPPECGRLLVARARDDEGSERLVRRALDRHGGEDAAVARHQDFERSHRLSPLKERIQRGRGRRRAPGRGDRPGTLPSRPRARRAAAPRAWPRSRGTRSDRS